MNASITLAGLAGLLVFLVSLGFSLSNLLYDARDLIDDITKYGLTLLKSLKNESSENPIPVLKQRIENKIRTINETMYSILKQIFNETKTLVKFINVTQSRWAKP